MAKAKKKAVSVATPETQTEWLDLQAPGKRHLFLAGPLDKQHGLRLTACGKKMLPAVSFYGDPYCAACKASAIGILTPDAGKGTATPVAAKTYQQCHHKHPPYPVADGIVIYGGSGNHPHITDCDVYVGLDDGARPGRRSWPWETGYDFVFPIKNFGVPASVDDFRALIDWLDGQLRGGKKVHVGCMAGHGRTGMVLAALRAKMHSPAQAIQHVRENYCKSAVETAGQVAWLVDHFGVDTAAASEKYADLGTAKPTWSKQANSTSTGFVKTSGGAIKPSGWITPDDNLIRDDESVEDYLKRLKL